jgi:hypothetical protein
MDNISRAALSSLGQRIVRRFSLPLSLSGRDTARLLRHAEHRHEHSAAWSGDLGSVAPATFGDFALAMTDQSLSNAVTPKFRREEFDLDAMNILDMPLAIGQTEAETIPASAFTTDRVTSLLTFGPMARTDSRSPSANKPPAAPVTVHPLQRQSGASDTMPARSAASDIPPKTESDVPAQAPIQRAPEPQSSTATSKATGLPRPSRSRIQRFARIEERTEAGYAKTSNVSLEEAAARLAQFTRGEEASEAVAFSQVSASLPAASPATEPELAGEAAPPARTDPASEAAEIDESATHLPLAREVRAASQTNDDAVRREGDSMDATDSANQPAGVDSDVTRAAQREANQVSPIHTAMPESHRPTPAPEQMSELAAPAEVAAPIQRSPVPSIFPPLSRQALQDAIAKGRATQPDAATSSSNQMDENDMDSRWPPTDALPRSGAPDTQTSLIEDATPMSAPLTLRASTWPALPDTPDALSSLDVPSWLTIDAAGNTPMGAQNALSDLQATAISTPAWSTARQLPNRVRGFTRDLPLAKIGRAQAQITASLSGAAESLNGQTLGAGDGPTLAARSTFTSVRGGLAQRTDQAERVLGGQLPPSTFGAVESSIAGAAKTIGQAAVGAVTPTKPDLHMLARQVYPYLKRLLAVERERTRGF